MAWAMLAAAACVGSRTAVAVRRSERFNFGEEVAGWEAALRTGAVQPSTPSAAAAAWQMEPEVPHVSAPFDEELQDAGAGLQGQPQPPSADAAQEDLRRPGGTGQELELSLDGTPESQQAEPGLPELPDDFAAELQALEERLHPHTATALWRRRTTAADLEDSFDMAGGYQQLSLPPSRAASNGGREASTTSAAPTDGEASAAGDATGDEEASAQGESDSDAPDDSEAEEPSTTPGDSDGEEGEAPAPQPSTSTAAPAAEDSEDSESDWEPKFDEEEIRALEALQLRRPFMGQAAPPRPPAYEGEADPDALDEPSADTVVPDA